MNEARDAYLSTYNVVDSVDHMVKISNINYVTWKFWHSPMRHAKAIGVVAAFHMYLECASGSLDFSWRVMEPMDFWTFCLRLSEQMLQYKPRANKYPGDAIMRDSTRV